MPPVRPPGRQLCQSRLECAPSSPRKPPPPVPPCQRDRPGAIGFGHQKPIAAWPLTRERSRPRAKHSRQRPLDRASTRPVLWRAARDASARSHTARPGAPQTAPIALESLQLATDRLDPSRRTLLAALFTDLDLSGARAGRHRRGLVHDSGRSGEWRSSTMIAWCSEAPTSAGARGVASAPRPRPRHCQGSSRTAKTPASSAPASISAQTCASRSATSAS